MALILNEKQTALAFGTFLGLAHLVWVIFVGVSKDFAKLFLDWALNLHHISLSFDVLAFNVLSAVGLVVLAFVAGLVFGFVFAKVWNWAGKQKYF